MAKSILEQYHFTEGEKLKGGFPIRILLEEDQEKKNLIGGGLVESIGMDKFNDYAIPIGLVSFQDKPFKLTEKNRQIENLKLLMTTYLISYFRPFRNNAKHIIRRRRRGLLVKCHRLHSVLGYHAEWVVYFSTSKLNSQ